MLPAVSYQRDAYWRVRYARVGVPGDPPKTELLSDGEGNWATSDGRALTYPSGCEYVDTSETPFTITLPIRRLGLVPGESADISVAYFDGDELQPWPEPQRYTRLKESDEGGLYRFVSLDGGSPPTLQWTRTAWSWTTRGCSRGLYTRHDFAEAPLAELLERLTSEVRRKRLPRTPVNSVGLRYASPSGGFMATR